TPFFVPQLKEETELEEICRLLVTADVRALPVLKDEKVTGVVLAKDVVKELQQEFKDVPVLELAKTKLITLKENDELGKMIKLFNQTGIDRVPVVNDAGKLVGIVSINDLMTKYQIFPAGKSQAQRMPEGAKHGKWAVSGFEHGEKQNLVKLPVLNILVKVPTVCVEDSSKTVADIIEHMAEHDVTSIVVTEKDKPVGIITVKDILMEFAKK
ncbi:MAG: CBS domain-containing protein, partial [Candidatus Woesearchaeota archaeon]